MEHTYLRYECADTFGVTVSCSSSKAPNSNAILAVAPSPSSSNNDTLVLTVAGSCVMGFSPQTALQPVLKWGHTQQQQVGSGKSLNGDEIVCLACSSDSQHIATGWVDGAVRIFAFSSTQNGKSSATSTLATSNSLLEDDSDSSCVWQSDSLLLNGHGGSPVRTVVFDDARSTASVGQSTNGIIRLASGGSDGTVVLWDIVAETGLYRLLGHRGGITEISFFRNETMEFAIDALITCSLDGLVKIWDLNHQCCIQTIVVASGGEVLAGVCRPISSIGSKHEEEHVRWRLVTGGNDGRVRVWSVQQSTSPRISQTSQAALIEDDESNVRNIAVNSNAPDDVCQFMGSLRPPPNTDVHSNEKVLGVQFTVDDKYVGVLRSKHIDVFLARSFVESQKKRSRRLKRRQEKSKKKISSGDDTVHKETKKRGILDDDESITAEENMEPTEDSETDPELLKASDEFEYIATVRTSHTMRSFRFLPKANGEMCRVVCALTTNALETHAVSRRKLGSEGLPTAVAEKIDTLDFYGHPTGIRSIAMSSDDRMACTVSKNVAKIWNVSSRSCIQSLPLAATRNAKRKDLKYGLCTAFLPGNTHVVVGTREGQLMLIDISAGDVVYVDERAHEGAIWSIDIRRPSSSDSSVTILTGAADKTVKFWRIESQDDDGNDYGIDGQPMLVHTRTLQMTDDVISVKFSHAQDSTKRLIFVSTLDCTVKVFFEDSLKMYLSLYGHKLPALTVDCSDDDVLLATAGADKTIKIWGLDFGDTHRTLHGHGDSITDLRFVRRSHNFFSCSKDGTVRYWDGDRFEQILLLNGHFAEVNCIAISRTGAFLLSGGMDRQVRVWERTKDIVFLGEERERELEHIFDRVNGHDEGTTAKILERKGGEADIDDEGDGQNEQPQSESAVRKSVLSVAAGDRIMEALERADQELKDISTFRATQGIDKLRSPNVLMLGMEPAPYVLWVLRTIKSAEVEQSLVLLSLRHIQRLMYYLIVLLKAGLGVEICSRVAVFVVKAHQNQVIATKTMAHPLRELKRLIRMRVAETRDVAGFNLAALKVIAKLANERTTSRSITTAQTTDIWAGLGLGSDVAAALEGRSKRR